MPPSKPEFEKRPRSIAIRGASGNNLKGVDLDLPLGQMTVVSGVSGSGKSTLVFDTIYAEGQRRYVETFSPYARQFFDRMDKAKADRIEGIPPAIALEQGNRVKTSRSTVGTLTEIADYLKLLYANLAEPWCPETGKRVVRHSPESVWREEMETGEREAGTEQRETDLLVLFPLVVPDSMSFDEAKQLLGKQGYRRLWLSGEVVELEKIGEAEVKRWPRAEKGRQIVVIQDRLKLRAADRARFIEAVECALGRGEGWVWIAAAGRKEVRKYTSKRICPDTGRVFAEPTPSLFSFNNPHGACPTCRGFGRTIEIDYDLAIPNRRMSLREGAIKPFQSEKNADCQRDLLRYCARVDIDVDTPFEDLPAKERKKVVEGDPRDPGATEWGPWYGVKGFFDWLESRSYKMHVRVLLSRYRAYRTCPSCGGRRFQPETLVYRAGGKNLGEVNDLPIEEALEFFRALEKNAVPKGKPNDPLVILFREITARLGYLQQVGLGYLNLNRSARTLSGGEVQRVHLTACLGSAMVNTLFVLDEPSVGLHARDVESLTAVMHQLRDKGNTLLVVEHDLGVIGAADHLVELGPGAGEAGGRLVYEGPPEASDKSSLTLDYLAGRRAFPDPKPRPMKNVAALRIAGASEHNLKNVSVDIPLRRLVCVTGVSGSGKSTLIEDVLYKNLQQLRGLVVEEPGRCEKLEGWEELGEVLMVDQSPIGRTPRSNPAVYAGAFDEVRKLYGSLPDSTRQGFDAGTFSFNSGDGRCPRCGGAGSEKIEMQFLSDLQLPCPECDGTRFRPDVLKIRYREKSVADVLAMTVDQASEFFAPGDHPRSEDPLCRRIVARLEPLRRVGLGYLRMGQGLNTLSGGEAQRLKVVGHLAETRGRGEKTNLLIFDEPTTGLHYEDVRGLLKV
ncbi:MAG: excinuclease ABC subunit UvrA, partial [Verrucomicrobiae bacterium]|nr:excinuclease ABC subunit UvrA [Verrucomicrobiae bacterium]